MGRTRIKFCGITRAVDAAAAVDAGADAVGMVFQSGAARRVAMETAKRIIAAVPPFVTPVALFVDASVDEVLSTTADLGIRVVQLHGNETPEMVGQLEGLTIVKAIRADPVNLSELLNRWRRAHRELPAGRLAGILLETAATGVHGGSGVENDWSLLESVRRTGMLEGLPPLIVAGGLTAANVGGVVRRLRPYAVDVSSGIEETKGVKSVGKMRAFVEAVGEADVSV